MITILKIKIDEDELRKLLMKAILRDAKEFEIYQAVLPVNRIIQALKKREEKSKGGAWAA